MLPCLFCRRMVSAKGRGVLTTVSATEWCGVYGDSTFKEWRKANGIERKAHKTNENNAKKLSVSIWEQDAGSSSLPTRTKWMRVGVLNSFLGLSNAPALVLWEKALLFQAFSFLMHSPVINIAKTKGAGFVVEKRKIPSFEPLVQISLSALFFAHGAIRTHPVSYS